MRWALAMGYVGVVAGGGSVAGAVLDYSAPLTSVAVDQQPPGAPTTVIYSVFDPARGTSIADSDNTGGVINLQNRDGVVTWHNGSFVFCRVYDPALGRWVKTNAAAGSTFDLQTSHGVVGWSSGALVNQWVYDAARQTWIGNTTSSGATSNLRNASGMIAWSSGALVYSLAFDPVRSQWVGEAIGVGGSVSDLVCTPGVVAWSAGNVVYFKTYDPLRTAWVGANVNSGNTFDLRAGDGVVAWSHLNTIYYYAYDPARGSWQGNWTASGQTFNLSLLNGTVSWSANTINYLRGYNTTNGTWAAALTVPFAACGVSTNLGNAPLPVWFFDMSLGASSWSWNFGDGQVSARRSPFHIFSAFARNVVTLSVTGPGGGSSLTNLTILSDIVPPTGTVLINNGAEFTTNQSVTLSLSATDNSGLAAGMRFSNDNAAWTAWEPFSTLKTWTLAAGTGTRTVYVQFRDSAQNEGTPVTDTIVLDTTPPPVAAFETSTFTIRESNSTATVRVFLSSSFARPVSVDYSSADGTALAGSDYLGANGRLVYPPGVTNQSFSITILHDTQVELNETVLLQLSNPTNAITGPSATLIILDDDLPEVSFGNSQYTAAENAEAALITVRLSAASGQAVTVQYRATNGTATPNVDYVPVAGTLTILPGQTVQTFPVPLLDDLLDELSETVSLTLFQPAGAQLGLLASATLVIEDNDPPIVNFARAAWTAPENSGSATLQVVLSTPFAETILVDYTTSNGTARAGSDYVMSSSTVIFGPGQTNKPIALTLFNDSEAESPETVLVYLTSAFSATLGPQSQCILIIEDDDIPRLSHPRLTTEGSFRATVTGPAGQRVAVERSTNLLQWAPLLNLTNAAGTADFVDPTPTPPPRRFYRARVLSP